MSSFALLLSSGADRVGIVDDLTRAILDVSCNIEESRMAVLGGEFAVMLLVSGENRDIESLLGGLDALGTRLGLELSGKRTYAPTHEHGGRPYRLDCISLDTPGIVHSVTGLLRRRGVNVDGLETETSGAPFTGAPMFHMRITMIIPRSVNAQALKTELADLAAEHDLDITIRPLVSGDRGIGFDERGRE